MHELFSLSGKSQNSYILNVLLTIEVSILLDDVENLSRGMYLLKIKTNQGTVTEKFVKD